MPKDKEIANLLFYGEDWVEFSSEYKDILRKVIQKKDEDKIFWDQHKDKELLHYIETYEGSPLVQHLDRLDLNIIKNIKTVMYIGRDKDHQQHSTPQSIFNKKYKELDLVSAGIKEIEINIITEKAPLKRYILDGMAILGIS